ncbi:hypothetical protein [Streptomyces sp. 8N706]|uniref:hypothetical protein n=1 Tax=Streptomyces sp. 8N706 TaxID=3457416 RepID=UPI003FD137E0
MRHLDLSLEFDADPRSSVRRYGPKVFETSPSPDTGQYELPQLVLVSGDGAAWSSVHDLRIIEVRDAGPELKHWLMTRWVYPGMAGERVQGRRNLEPPVSVPTELLPPAPPDGGGRLSCDVIWGVAFTSGAAQDAGVQRVPFTVTLEFVLVPHGAAEEPEEELYGLRRRTLTDRDRVFPGFAAVDFGTTASTVTLFDPRQDNQLPIDPEQERQLRVLLADLLEDSPPATSASAGVAWKSHLDGLIGLTGRSAGDERIDSVAALASRLRDGRPLPAGLLDRVCLELDKSLSSESEALSHWLALRLHEVYDRALDVPPLARVRLRQVTFREELPGHRTFIESGLKVEESEPPSFTIGASIGKEHTVCPDLKRYLGETRQIDVPGLPAHHSLTTDYLYTHVYHELLGHAQRFAARDRDPEARPVNRIAVTYPTTTAPSARAALAKLLLESLDATEVCADYDEGVAAGLFFVLRDLGMDLGNGVEALRARSHEVEGAERPTWEQSGLVIDIGGGTTDIALLRLTLTERDPDPVPGETIAASARGVHYDLSPEVVGSTGHTQLGGDFLSLRVFYWIKARVVDELLRGEGHSMERDALAALLPESLRTESGALLALTEAVLGYGLEDDVAPADVRQILNNLLPSQWPEGESDPASHSVFNILWGLAEEAKKTLGGADEASAGHFTVPADKLKELRHHAFDLPGRKAPYGEELFPAEGVRLEREQFRRLTRPVIHRVASIAADLVTDNLDRLPGGRLDRVMLSGRSTLMPLVRDGIVEWFTGNAPGAAPLPWNAAALSQETRYAKQAASIGAAWAYALKNTEWEAATGPSAKGDGSGIMTAEQRGLTAISLDTRNLFLGMPCTMYLLGGNTFVEGVFKTGQQFEELDETGRLGRYSNAFSLPRKIFLQRVTGSSSSVNWGSLDLVEHAGREHFRPSESLWWGAGGRRSEQRVQARIEVDHQLNPAVHIFLGPEHYLVQGEALDLAPVLMGQSASDEDGKGIRALPWAVHVETGKEEEADSEVFAAGPLGGAEPLQLHESADAQTPGLAGAVAQLPPPLREGALQVYRFVAVGRDGTRRDLGELNAPGEWGAKAAYHASLTSTGRLRVHRGRVPFLPAKDLREVQERPGAVRRLAMARSESPVNEMWNPYSGRH